MTAVQPHLTRTDIPCFTAGSGRVGLGTVEASVRLLGGEGRERDAFEILVSSNHDRPIVESVISRAQAKCLLSALQAALLHEGA